MKMWEEWEELLSQFFSDIPKGSWVVCISSDMQALTQDYNCKKQMEWKLLAEQEFEEFVINLAENSNGKRVYILQDVILYGLRFTRFMYKAENDFFEHLDIKQKDDTLNQLYENFIIKVFLHSNRFSLEPQFMRNHTQCLSNETLVEEILLYEALLHKKEFQYQDLKDEQLLKWQNAIKIKEKERMLAKSSMSCPIENIFSKNECYPLYVLLTAFYIYRKYFFVLYFLEYYGIMLHRHLKDVFSEKLRMFCAHYRQCYTGRSDDHDRNKRNRISKDIIVVMNDSLSKEQYSMARDIYNMSDILWNMVSNLYDAGMYVFDFVSAMRVLMNEEEKKEAYDYLVTFGKIYNDGLYTIHNWEKYGEAILGYKTCSDEEVEQYFRNYFFKDDDFLDKLLM